MSVFEFDLENVELNKVGSLIVSKSSSLSLKLILKLINYIYLFYLNFVINTTCDLYSLVRVDSANSSHFRNSFLSIE
jgi:hypothetical protein